MEGEGSERGDADGDGGLGAPLGSTEVGDGYGGGGMVVSSESVASEGAGDRVGGRAGVRRRVRAVCEVCGRSMPLTKAGKLRVHGPLNNRCDGSGMLSSSLSQHSQQVSPRRPHL